MLLVILGKEGVGPPDWDLDTLPGTYMGTIAHTKPITTHPAGRQPRQLSHPTEYGCSGRDVVDPEESLAILAAKTGSES